MMKMSKKTKNGNPKLSNCSNYKNNVKFMSVFTPKGGDGKTTITATIGWALAALGHKVIVVDCDDKMDLSNFLLGRRVKAVGYSSLRHYLESNTDIRLSTACDAHFEPVQGCSPILTSIPIMNAGDGWMKLVVGGNMDKISSLLTVAFTQGKYNRYLAVNGLPGFIYNILLNTAKSTGADYVIFDTPSSHSALYRTILSFCDCYTIPAKCSELSSNTIVHMSRGFIKDLVIEAHEFNGRFLNDPQRFSLPDPNPKFLGLSLFMVDKKLESLHEAHPREGIVHNTKEHFLPSISSGVVGTALVPDGINYTQVDIKKKLLPPPPVIRKAFRVEDGVFYTVLETSFAPSLDLVSKKVGIPIEFLTKDAIEKYKSLTGARVDVDGSIQCIKRMRKDLLTYAKRIEAVSGGRDTKKNPFISNIEEPKPFPKFSRKREKNHTVERAKEIFMEHMDCINYNI